MDSKNTSPARGRVAAEDVFGERLLSTKDVASIFGVAETTVRDWIARGELMATKFGKAFYISATALRESKQAKEEAQRKEFQTKRLEAERHEELGRRRAREPGLHWALTHCLACGLVPVFTTRNMRLDGNVFCASCADHVKNHTLTKDAWERKIAVLVAELNAAQGSPPLAQRTPSPSLPEWFVDRCPVCGKPQPLSRSNLKDPQFFLSCDHPRPYGAGPSSFPHPLVIKQEQAVIARHLAHVEAQIRNLEEGSQPDPDVAWRVCRCAHCGEEQAVANREQRLVGRTTCRHCRNDARPLEQQLQAQVIVHALREMSAHNGARYMTVRCACGELELIDGAKGGGLILSWCKERPFAERERLAIAYAERYAMPGDILERLYPDDYINLDEAPF